MNDTVMTKRSLYILYIQLLIAALCFAMLAYLVLLGRMAA